MGAITITTFGEPVIAHDNVACSISLRKLLALVLYLAVSGQPHTRAQLIAMFWPEADDAHGQVNLRQFLRRLRLVLGADADAHLISSGNLIRLNLGSEGSIDVAQLRAATTSLALPAEQEAALRSYAGAFLAHLTLDEAPDFMDWLIAQRAYWEGCYDLVAERAITRLLEGGRATDAETLAQAWVAHRPDCETAYRLLASAQIMAGDARGAHLTLTAAKRRWDEIGLSLTPETLAFWDRLPMQSSTESPKPHLSLPFIGRDEAFSQLRHAWHQVMSGQCDVALIQGEAGIGKSRLVDTFAKWAQVQGADVSTGHAYELSGRLPYQPLMELLQQRLARERAPDDLLEDSWLIELQRLAPDLHNRYPDLPMPVDDAAAGARLLEAIAQMGIALGRRHPLLWVIEDLHWADDATRDALLYLLERWRAEQVPALLVGTLRREEILTASSLARWLASMERAGGVTEVLLGPLTTEQTTQAVASLLTDALEPTVGDWLAEVTQGNPLYLMHVVQALVEREALQWQDGTLHQVVVLGVISLSQWLPESLRELLLRRVRRLDPTTQQVLVAASVVGTRFREEVVLRVAKISEDTLLTALEESERSLLINTKAGQYGFTHDKVAEALYGDLTLARRRTFHRRAMQALVEEGNAPAADLMRHAIGAEAWEAVVRYGQQVIEAAIQIGAHLDALRFQEHLVHLLTTPPSQAVLRTRLEDKVRMAIYDRLGVFYLKLGRTEQARTLYTTLIEEARASREHFIEGRALLLLGQLVIQHDHDPGVAQGLLESAFQIAAASGDDLGRIRAKFWLTEVALASEELPRARAFILESIQIARASHIVFNHAQCLNELTEIAIWSGEWEQACAASEESLILLALLARNETITEMPQSYMFTTPLSWPSFLAQIEALLHSEPTKMSNAARQWGGDSLAKMGNSRLHLGEGATGRAALQVAWQISSERNEMRFQYLHLHSRTLGWLEAGGYERALQEALHVLDAYQAALDRVDDPTTFRPLCALIDIHHALFQPAKSQEYLEQATERAADKAIWYRLLPATRWCTYYALMGDWDAAHHAALQAQMLRDSSPTQLNWFDLSRYYETEALLRAGNRDRAVTDAHHLEEQLGSNRRYRLVWLRMQALLDRDADDHDACAAHLREALQLAEQLGLPGEQWQSAAQLTQTYLHMDDAVQTQEAARQTREGIIALATQITTPDLRDHFMQAALSRLPVQG